MNREEKINRLNQLRGKIESNVGGWRPGSGVFCHGYSMLEELIGEVSYFQLIALNATGKLVDKSFADWLEGTYGCLSWPDPRIWCNQIGALAGVARVGAVAATSLGCLTSDSRDYGPFTIFDGMAFITDALKRYKSGESAADIVASDVKSKGGKPFIVGYIRPIARGDERVVRMEKIAKKLGFKEGEHLKLAYEIEEILMKEHNEGMNFGGYMSAFMADQGFSSQEAYQMITLMVGSGVTACYLDAYNKDPEEFLPLRCDDIEYSGPAPRAVNVS